MVQDYKKGFLILLLLLFSTQLFAQKTIEGTITNAKTDDPLPAANIVIQGVYQGTISNRNGFYRLAIADSLLPATIRISYIGYHSKKRIIRQSSPRVQNFRLKPSVTQLEALSVTAKAADLTVMERVIRRKQQWLKKLHTYKAEAYSRQILSKDTAIVSITESISTIYWGEDKGSREVLKWRNQTRNIEIGNNFAGVSYLPNLYNNNIEIAGYNLVGITHPEASSYYNFKIIDLLSIDGQRVYKIKVIPDKTLQPLFTGVAYVLDEKFALLKVNLSLNDVVRFPTPIQDFNLRYRQQFNNFGRSFWLPVNVRIQGELKIDMLGLEFPRMKFRQVARITNYKVNIPLPDSLYEDEDLITIDSTDVAKDSLFLKKIERIPLSPKEERAYATIDSAETIEEAFKPSGFLARFIDNNEEKADTTDSNRFNIDIPGSFSPRLHFNRVDGFYGGLIYKIEPVDRLTLSVEGGYSMGYNAWSYGAGAEFDLTESRIQSSIGISYLASTAPRYSSFIWNPTMSSLPNLLGFPNYFDYFRNEGFKAYAKLFDLETELSLKVAFLSKNQSSTTQETGYDILGREQTVRPNPAINEGRLHSINAKIAYNLDEDYSFGITGLKRITFNVEYSNEALGSDFNFIRYSTNIFWNFETFLRRRLFPNKLFVRLSAGTFSGRLPIQKFGIADVAEGFFSPFGVLRTTRFRPFEGEQYAALFIEHNFRTVPFELLGLGWAAGHNIGIIAFGSVARSWISEERLSNIIARTAYIPKTTDDFYYEAGLSITGILSLFRVDFAYRLDEPGLFVGVSLTRYL